MVRSAELEKPVSLTQGEYRMSLGEKPLGMIEVHASADTVDVSLPGGTPGP